MELPSLREGLAAIGVDRGRPFSYRDDFVSHPDSFRAALRSMVPPTGWEQVTDIDLADSNDQYWTDEVQGVAWDGANWIFSCNANQKKPSVEDKALYVFANGVKLHDGNWICRVRLIDVHHQYVDDATWAMWWNRTFGASMPVPPTPYYKESWEHWGQLTFYEGFLYVAHYWTSGPLSGRKNVVVFRDEGGQLSYDSWIEIGEVEPTDGGSAFTPEFQAINPWDGLIYTSHGGPNAGEFYLHHPRGHPQAGQWTGDVLKFTGGYGLLGQWVGLSAVSPLDMPSDVQGACFSPNGHLYIACNARIKNRMESKAVGVFSALNGHYLGMIPVLAKESEQELEGVCYAHVGTPQGGSAQIHVVLLENEAVALDDMYLKGYSADDPSLV